MDTQSMLLAIVQHEDASDAAAVLENIGARVIRISSIGAFLRAGNVTLLAELDFDKTARAIQLLTSTCHQRTAHINMPMPAPSPDVLNYIGPLPVNIGGATIFILPIKQMVRVGAQIQVVASGEREREDGQMNLIIAVVSEEHTNPILDALVAAHYRATLVSTMGGVMQKGNATLLIGVESDQVDDVIQHIHTACGMNGQSEESCALVFVLDVKRFEHV